MSQVRNLRAMFENKGDDPSPPDRGRSPGVPWPGPTSSDSPRPLSKVRTSFVAIEKDGRMGLRSDPSHESSPSKRCPSTDMDPENSSLEDVGRTPRKLFAKDGISKSPSAATEPSITTTSGDTDGTVPDKPSHSPEKKVDEEQPGPSLARSDPTERDPINGSKLAHRDPVTGGKTKMDSSIKDEKSVPAKKSSITRPSAASAKTAAKGPSKSGPTSKTSSGTVKRLDPSPRVKTQDKLPARGEPGTTTSSKSASKPPGSTSGRKPAPVKPSREHDTGFVKPKPKSPTKPVSLPASLMASTASSVSKGAGGRQTLSRQSGSLQPPNATVRAPSRASMTTAGNSATKTVKRQASTINRPRPSLGPPPKKFAQDHPVPKKDTHVDESFLARMMRPTQASSSKTNEKAPPTPPRKSAARPSTSNTNYTSRRASSVKRQPKPPSPAGNKLVSSLVGDTTQDSAEMVPRTTELESNEKAIQSPQQGELQSDQQRVEDVAPEVAVVETPHKASVTSEEDNTAKATIELEEPSPEQELSNEAALETAQAENVETPIALEEPNPETKLPKEAASVMVQVETAEEMLDVSEEGGLAQTPEEPRDTRTEVEEAPVVQAVAFSEEEPGHVDEPQKDRMAEEPDEPQLPEPLLQADEVAEAEGLVASTATSEDPITEAQSSSIVADNPADREEPNPITGTSTAEANNDGEA